jgi:hypothetical protein
MQDKNQVLCVAVSHTYAADRCTTTIDDNYSTAALVNNWSSKFEVLLVPLAEALPNLAMHVPLGWVSSQRL